MKALLLAAGRGKRLQPLTDTTPKPLLKVAGIPIIERIIIALKSAGIRRIGIITGHLAEQIETFVSGGSPWNLSIECFRQPVYDGTGHAVLPAADFLEREPFFLGYGDIMTDPRNYGRLMDYYRNHIGESILCAWKVDDPSIGGVVVTEGDRLTGLIEKPSRENAPGNMINAGLMILQPEIMTHIRNLKPSVRNEYELTDAILMLAGTSVIRVLPLETYWSDIGTIEKLREADLFFQGQNLAGTDNFRHRPDQDSL